MHDEHGVRTAPHQFTGPTGMIEMNVRQDNVFDAISGNAQQCEGSKRGIDGIISTGVDDRGTIPFDDDMDRGEIRTFVTGINGADAVVIANNFGRWWHWRAWQ